MSSSPSSPKTFPQSSETTPLLQRSEDATSNRPASVNESLDSSSHKRTEKWPTIIALTALCLSVALICFGLTLPSAIQEYAKEGLVFEPTKLSVDSFTALGIKARVQGTFYLDASKVHNKATRDLGRLGTWIAREVESDESSVKVYLPDYDNVLLGSAIIPPIKVNVRNQHYNYIDFYTDLEPGDVEGIRQLAKDFLDHKIQEISVKAIAQVSVQSGLIKLGQQTLTQFLQFSGGDVPTIPAFDIQNLRFAEYGLPGHPDGLKAMAAVTAKNEYPVNFDVPPFAFEILLPDCEDDYLLFATASTEVIHVKPEQNVTAKVTALVSQLPNSLTSACPGSKSSPLDSLVADYLAGRDTTVYIRGGNQDPDTPDWIGNLLKETTLPFSLPGHPFDNLIKNFSLTDTHFSLPDPGSEKYPKISAVVKVLVGMPADMEVNLDVNEVRADAQVFYKGKLLGNLDLSKWQKANATKVGRDLLVQSIVQEAPLIIEDESVFTKVVQELLFGDGVALSVHAVVDVNTLTALGEFVVRNIPAEGQIFVAPLGGGGFKMPEIKGMEIVETSEHALTLQATVNVTNPTEYSATIPYCNVSLVVNETRVGYAWVSANIVPGPNEVVAQAAWEVSSVGREWLSQFVSGYNTTLTVQTHANSIPGVPDIGLSLTIPTPKLFGRHFLKETTMHLLSSTATFVLVSPFALFITSIAASAFYNDTEVGTITWKYPFAIEEGENTTPKLPVEWGGNALGTIRDALGGTLKLDASADVGVRIGEWNEQIWYQGKGLGANIRL
ncbi:hypothetical protein PV10_08428 [Exophiala mesophila]|uniref:Uncharacterized protein n=1 Tax=Exophiala mesophila TaxID=212818 RepID=A0A0D1ZPQ1_EXOME|nr:uncharacterized protein PV10_08428 [Exophiala mesophila]KIV88783.1 hypothetical protein PV10_08428 [Exophiala mesophila]